MSRKSTSTNDMTVGSPLRSIITFAIPLILGYILQQMYLIIDAAIVGRWIGVGALAAVGASASIMFLIMGFCNGSCAGFAIPVAQAFGAKDYQKMRAYVSNSIRIAVVFAVVITFLSCIFCDKILHLVNTPKEVFDDAYVFLMLQFAAIPFTIAYNLLSGQIRALGNSKQPFFFLITASIVNIILDGILILGMGLGVEGAGIATWLSQGLSVVLCIFYIKKKMQVLIPQGEERKFDNKKISILLNNGVPMGLQFSITAIGSIMLQSANNALGTVYVAAFTASMRIKYLFTCVFENIGVAMATYCGQNLGARKLERIGQGVRAAIKMMIIYFVITFLIIYPFADWMMMLFVDKGETEVVTYAAQFMRIANYFYPCLGLLTILRYSIQGLGYSNLSMLSGVMEMIARCGVSLWLVPALAWTGVCFGDPVAWVMADMFLIPAFWWLYRHLKKNVVLGNLLVILCLGLSLTGCAQSSTDHSTDIDGHHFIDLQLPSGLLWAETNLGAASSTDCGYQYAWGETEVKEDYSQATYRYGTDFEKMTKYNATDQQTTLSPTDDVATTLWGKGCRIPTFAELEELGDTTNCTWTWVTKTTDKGKSVKGYEVKSVRNGNSIFLPAAGAHNGKNYFNDGNGLYWTSTIAPRSSGEAWCLYFNLGHYSYYMNDRSIGASIRAVAIVPHP